MKKLYLILAIGALIGFNGCNKDDDGGNTPPTPPVVTNDSINLVAVYDATGTGYIKSKWELSDSLGVVIVSGTTNHFRNISCEPTEATDSCLLKSKSEALTMGTGENKIYIYYPYNEEVTSATAVPVPQSDVQVQDKESLTGNLAYSYLYGGPLTIEEDDFVSTENYQITVPSVFANNSWPISFPKACTLMKVTISSNVNLAVPADATLDLTNGNLSAASQSIELTFGENGTECDLGFFGTADKTIHFVMMKSAVDASFTVTADVIEEGTSKQYTMSNVELTNNFNMGTYKPSSDLIFE